MSCFVWIVADLRGGGALKDKHLQPGLAVTDIRGVNNNDNNNSDLSTEATTATTAVHLEPENVSLLNEEQTAAPMDFLGSWRASARD